MSYEKHRQETPPHLETTGERIQLGFDQVAGLPPDEKLRYFTRRILGKMKRKISELQKTGRAFLQLGDKAPKPDAEIAGIYLEADKTPVGMMLLSALSRYVPRSYPGRIILFRTVVPDGDELADDRGWSEIAEGGLEIHDIPGGHQTIFEPRHVPVLAEKLEACLRATLGSSHGLGRRD